MTAARDYAALTNPRLQAMETESTPNTAQQQFKLVVLWSTTSILSMIAGRAAFLPSCDETRWRTPRTICKLKLFCWDDGSKRRRYPALVEPNVKPQVERSLGTFAIGNG